MTKKNDDYDYLFKLIIIGDSYVGKTNIMSQYIKKEFNENSKSTIGVEFGNKIIKIDDKIIKAQIWDTAGQERYKSITSAYYKGAKGAFIVYDITSKTTFNSVDKWIQDLNLYGDKNLTLLLIGNKSDLEEKRQIKKEDGEEKAKSFGLGFIETSACTGENIDKAFDILLKEVCNKYHVEISNNEELENVNKGKNIEIEIEEENNTVKKKSCC
jgi:Ras-related protein Rab-11A